jgi:hypothetical protein
MKKAKKNFATVALNQRIAGNLIIAENAIGQ